MIHTLSLFPSLFDFQLFAPLFLRIAVGVFLFLIGFDSIKKQKSPEGSQMPNQSFVIMVCGGLAIITSILILIGMFTQGAALIAIVLILLNSLFQGKVLMTAGTSGDALLLIIIICIVLLFYGAGMPAIDLPL